MVTVLVCTNTEEQSSIQVNAANIGQYLGASVTALDAQLVDLSLSNISSLLSLIQLMLQFAELAKMNISLFLLFRSSKSKNVTQVKKPIANFTFPHLQLPQQISCRI